MICLLIFDSWTYIDVDVVLDKVMITYEFFFCVWLFWVVLIKLVEIFVIIYGRKITKINLKQLTKDLI